MTEDTISTESLSKLPTTNVLSKHDQKLLYETGVNIVRHIETDYPYNLPDVIVLPEASARPLKYLFDPALEKIAKERGVKKPAFVFFQMPTGIEKDAVIRYRDYKNAPYDTAKESLEKFIAEQESNIDYKNTLRWYSLSKSKRVIQQLIGKKPKILLSTEKIQHITDSIRRDKKVLAVIDRVPEILDSLSNRAKQIKKQFTTDNKPPQIAIIDEHTGFEPVTLSVLDDAFLTNSYEARPNKYSLIAVETRDTSIKHGIHYSQDDLIAFTINDQPWGFEYNKKQDNYDRKFQTARSGYGVKKTSLLDSNTVAPDKDADRLKISGLREDMSTIGELIASSMDTLNK